MRSIVSNISYRAVHVWRRNLDVYLTTWATNMLPPLLEPFQYLVAFGLGLGGAVGMMHFRGLTVTYMRFIAPGTISIAIMFWSYFETTFSSFVRMYYQKTFDAITATPLMLEDVICGELLWGTTKSVFAVSVMLVVLSLLGFVSYPTGLLVLPLAAIGGLLFSAISMLATSRVPSIDNFNLPMFLFIFPMFVFSGTFFPVDNLPAWARTMALFLPLTHISRLVRAATLGRFGGWDYGVMGLFLVGAVALGLLAIAGMRHRLVK
jgi:lipooligosaccharide transport system permease protein